MSGCSKIVNHTTVVVTEKGKGAKNKFVLLNIHATKIKIVTVDGCEIKTGPRCDYLLIDELETEYFVELKGSDILYGCEQIESSIKQLSSDLKRKKASFIVSNFYPPAITGSIQIKKAYFKKHFNSSLVIKNKVYEHTID